MPHPPIHAQRAIAEVLGALDDKIVANDRLARVVDDYCESLFQELAGSEVRPLSQIATVNRSAVRPGGGEVRYLDIGSVSVGGYQHPEPIPWAAAPGRARREVSAGDTVWSTVRPGRRSHALVLDQGLVGSTGLAVISPLRDLRAVVYESTRTAAFTSYLEAVAEGSAYPAVRAERFNEAPVPEMGASAEREFERIAYPARVRAHVGAVESRHLAALRDALLPPLMTGRLAVREAEQRVEALL